LKRGSTRDIAGKVPRNEGHKTINNHKCYFHKIYLIGDAWIEESYLNGAFVIGCY
jgi:hypothetical protein